MLSIANQSQLESEIIALVSPDANDTPIELTRPTTRQSALQMLSRCAQSLENASELIIAAATLAATTLDLDVIVAADTALSKSNFAYSISQRSEGQIEQLLSESREARPAESVAGFVLDADHPIVVDDLENDRRFVDESLLQSGACSGIACPIQYEERKFGVIGVFSCEKKTFKKDDVLFIHSLALLLGPALAHRRAEKALADQSKFLSSTIDSLESLVLLLNDSGEILRLNKTCRKQGGFTLEEAQNRTLWGTFLLPEETALVHNVFTRLKAGEPTVRCETFLLTKQGTRRRISWNFSRLPFKSERGPSIIASGIDITDQHSALAKLDEVSGVTRELKAHISNSIETKDTSRTPQEDESGELGIEHRAYPRRPYGYMQEIGICRGEALPNRSEFFEVSCHDISPRGFSFITKDPPKFFEFVVTFGTPPAQSFLKSRIVHVSPIIHEGQSWLLVGCEYIRRVGILE